ncbi:MAG: site-specific integrase [Firmicutes bacterium]|nr:site-specific integrase [Bacillota bacterium]
MASIRTKKNKDGSIAYVVRVYAGRDEEGRSRYLSRTYTPAPHTSPRKISQTLKALCAELQQKAKDPESDRSILFSGYAQHFLQRKSLTAGEYTLQSYRLALRKACETIGDVPLADISTRHLDDLTLALTGAESQYGKPYSQAYIRHILTLIRGCLGMAVREGLLRVNVADRIHYTPPRAVTREPVFLEKEEARAYIHAALKEKDLRIRAMVLLYLYTGIRMEELCGLEWGDIDFASKQICIRRASVYVPGCGVLTKEPKTRSGGRILCADPAVFTALHAYRNEQQKNMRAIGKTAGPESRLFTRRDGGPLIPGETAVWLRRFAKRHGLREVSPHKLRHTFATLQIAYGTDIRTVAGVMGHSSPTTTLTIYAHQIREASEKAARAMSNMLTPKDYPE